MLPRYRYLPLIRQAEATECAHACLAMIAKDSGKAELKVRMIADAGPANPTTPNIF